MNIFLTLQQVLNKTGLSKSMLYEMVASQSFPQQIHISQRRVVWLASEIEEWMLSRIKVSRQQEVQHGL